MPGPAIVLGIDFTEGSRRAAQAVGVLARAMGGRLLLVHAFPAGKTRLSGAAKRSVAMSVAQAEVAEAEQLTQVAESLRGQGFGVEAVAVPGKPAEVLLQQAKRSKAGLIAVGTSGRRGVGGIFLGSVAQDVLRKSPVPVLVTPSRHRAGSKKAGPVLVGIDFSPASQGILDAAAGLARDLGVPLHAFHAVPLPFVTGAIPDGGLDLTPELLAADEVEAVQRLTDMVEALRVDVKVKVLVGLGDAATHIVAQAQALGASAIVVGRRKPGRRLGSTSAAVVHAADRPVIVVPAEFVAKGKKK